MYNKWTLHPVMFCSHIWGSSRSFLFFFCVGSFQRAWIVVSFFKLHYIVSSADSAPWLWVEVWTLWVWLEHWPFMDLLQDWTSFCTQFSAASCKHLPSSWILCLLVVSICWVSASQRWRCDGHFTFTFVVSDVFYLKIVITSDLSTFMIHYIPL